jgi:RHH-type proline utilization regulon transcriptional repressor/proline dehydrogenase/delta 1-pyrroline-5-carboxylate dehydrogenase
MTDRIYPQFATHNAHTVAAVLEMAGDRRDGFEFQRLHGMGEALHEIVRAGDGTRCRIYAPVGAHRDLLAYLVRRLLENGANSPSSTRSSTRTSRPRGRRRPFPRWPRTAGQRAGPEPCAPGRATCSRRSAPTPRASTCRPASFWPASRRRARPSPTTAGAAPMLAGRSRAAPEAGAERNPADPATVGR